MESMSDIIWIVNPENDLMDSLITRMRIYFSDMMESKGIKYGFTTGEEVGDIKLNMEKRRNFYLIFKEAINNLAKYAECSEADVIISGPENGIEMKIKDNGTGFNPEDLYGKGNGLKNMKERAKLLDGDFVIESIAGYGTTITLTFPLP